MDLEQLQKMAKVVFGNDDYNFNNFLKSFAEKGQFANGPNALRVKKAATRATTGNRFKTIELDYLPYEGIFSTNWNGKEFFLHLERGTHVLVTECRQIDYLKTLTVYG